MTYGYIQYSDFILSLSLIDTRSKHLSVRAERRTNDCIMTLPTLWKKYFAHITHVVVSSTASRFSLSRQLALACNLLAHEYGNRLYVTQESGQTHAQDPGSLRHASWKSIMSPRYTHEPNITIRKRI